MSDYSTNLTEKQWQVINNIVKSQEKSRKTSLREIINAIFHLIKSGCQWRMLPTDFAPGKQFIIIFASRNRKKCGRNCRMFFISWQGNQSVNRKVPAWVS
ncbi:transposase [Bacteroides sp. KH569_7]|uniref:Transposase n=1 Tax=Bacteroides muris (ex Fokt et al. 2023) TaxID=2937417 RepID=A0A9X2SWH8_9BACE|nr:transposase [Bacteroides muris (ex Fokt et al. 2023)]MCR6507692.1 transposase [Bacteroides muris (ex Fokt et al. 2023)]